MSKDAKIDLRISSDLKHRIALEAARDNRTSSGVITVAVESYLAKSPRNPPSSKAQKDRADE